MVSNKNVSCDCDFVQEELSTVPEPEQQTVKSTQYLRQNDNVGIKMTVSNTVWGSDQSHKIKMITSCTWKEEEYMKKEVPSTLINWVMDYWCSQWDEGITRQDLEKSSKDSLNTIRFWILLIFLFVGWFLLCHRGIFCGRNRMMTNWETLLWVFL